jgi:triosephosphate isomerase
MSGARKKPLVAGNWKMHLTIPEARELVRGILGAAPEVAGADLVVIPPFTALAEVAGLVRGTDVRLGGQNLHWEEKGCRYVIVGHSERRQRFGETDETVQRKVGAALKAGLTPILCVGETLEEREAGKTAGKVDAQIDAGLAGRSAEEIPSVILAYEPIWAIGTGRTASPSQAEEVQARIRRRLEEKYGNGPASCAIILYGGSVKPANSYSLFKEKDIDGFLVGGASLEADSFIGIAREALRAYGEET